MQRKETKNFALANDNSLKSVEQDAQKKAKNLRQLSIFANKKRGSGVRTKLLNNVLCFIEYELQATTCTIRVHTKIRPDPITCVLEDVNPHRFNIDQVIARLSLTLLPVAQNLAYESGVAGDCSKEDENLQREAIQFDSHLIVVAQQSENNAWIDQFEEGLFYKVPKHIISFVEGSRPNKL